MVLLAATWVDSPHPTVVADAQGRVLSMNAFAASLLQWDEGAALGMTVVEVLGFPIRRGQGTPTDDAPPSSSPMAAQSTFSEWARRRDGTTFPVEVTYACFLCQTQQLTILHFCDVSSRRAAEMRLRQLSSALEQTADHTAITDSDGTILYVNRAFEEVTGYSRQLAIGKPLNVVKPDKRDATTFYRDLWATLRSGSVFRGEVVNRNARGDLYVDEQRISPFTDEATGETYYIAIGRDVTERHFRDALTGLPTRASLLDRVSLAIARAERRSRMDRFALMFIDLDRFKSVNDAHGNLAGDQVLVEIGCRIRRVVRRVDAVAQVSHLDRDEFAVLLEDLRSPEDVNLVAQRIRDAIRAPIALPNGDSIVITASVGIAFPRREHLSPEAMLQDAETAMRRAKTTPDEPYQVFDLAMHERAHSRLRLETELRLGLERDQFVLHYQPIISLASGKITSCEALIRWNHPTRGFLPPADFIGIAEESGLIVPLGQFVIEKACQTARSWQSLTRGDVSVAVNISVRQLSEGHLVDAVADALARTGLASHLLKLEVTESIAASQPEAAIAILRALKGLGVELLIDDFGTGHSSLSRLTRFPLDKLKIDRSFVTQIPDGGHNDAVAAAIVAMAHALGLGVIAEGVETLAQAAYLRTIGCEEMQGYLLGKPMPASEFERLLAGDSPCSFPGDPGTATG
jgi:diguanylate cyclase (GGDEF)-like protein/PAS domain S-box-containing protein